MLKSVELFAGGGGLTLGLSQAGFDPVLIVERDTWSCDTLSENKNNGLPCTSDWNILCSDVRDIDYSQMNGDIDLVSGGPPCQPFSLGGKHKAFNDDRDMFPAAIEALRQLRPRAFIFENVKGLTRTTFAEYLRYIKLQMRFPELTRKSKQDWTDHLTSLDKCAKGKRHLGLEYRVEAHLVNAADYGVPQQRFRILFVGFRSDEQLGWKFPEKTHSEEALLKSQWMSDNYWNKHQLKQPKISSLSPRLASKVQKLQQIELCPDGMQPWQTVRDAIASLPCPQSGSALNHLNHKFQAGAKVYPGHTGSPIDLPSKALKAGDHGVPGGENMLVNTDGSVRYYTVRESARLQTFPDTYAFHGSWSETMRQLGNAVPVKLARVVGNSVAMSLLDNSELNMKSSILHPARLPHDRALQSA